MANPTVYKFAQHYEENFDPKMYLETIVLHPLALEDVRKPVIALQHGAFKQHGVQGERVLDVGTGPCAYLSLVPAQHFREVYLSDYVSRCRQLLRDWLEQPDKAYDVTPLTHHVASLYGNVKPPGFYEETLRQRIKEVLPVDVLCEDPFHGLTVVPFDCITTSACLEAACTTLENFEKSVENLMKYLKTNGYFFHMTFISAEYYCLGDVRFNDLNITSDQIKQAYAKGGLAPLFYEERGLGKALQETVPGESAGMAIGLWTKNSDIKWNI